MIIWFSDIKNVNFKIRVSLLHFFVPYGGLLRLKLGSALQNTCMTIYAIELLWDNKDKTSFVVFKLFVLNQVFNHRRQK